MMPTLRLHPAETKELALPLVCACCSRPPVAYVKRTFTIKEKYPGFGLTIPAQSCDVHLPLCGDHESYWQQRARTRNRVFWFILLGAGWAWLVVTGGILLARALKLYTELGVEPAFALRGIHLPCSQFEAAFVSTAHTEADIARTIGAAREAMRELA
jgi:hypothetical protein